MNFAETLTYLLSLGHETLAIKLGLENIRLLLGKLGNPQLAFPAVQIAGTNGKGSTAAILDAICEAATVRCGLYTSPHLNSITERISIAGRDISAEEFAAYATKVRTAAEDLVKDSAIEALPSFFEQVTAIAFFAFRQAGVDLAILETGMGGRLDATSAAGAEIVGITQIALDHEEYLGGSITSIATEKAAIIRKGVSVVIASQKQDVMKVLLEQCERVGTTPTVVNAEHRLEGVSDTGRFYVTFTTPNAEYDNVCLALRGRHQIQNAAVAIALAERLADRGFPITSAAIVHGLKSARHPGRLELFEGHPQYLLDGAHNAAGVLALRKYLDEFVRGGVTLVFGAMREKRLGEMAELLFPAAINVVLTKPDSPRAASPEALRQIALCVVPHNNVWCKSEPQEALAVARSCRAADGVICIAGSLYLVGQLRPLIVEEARETTRG